MDTGVGRKIGTLALRRIGPILYLTKTDGPLHVR